MPEFSFAATLFLILLGAVSCGQPVAQAEEAAAPPSRRQMTRNAMRASVWRFVYCLEEDDDPTELRALLEEIAGAQPFGKRIDVVSCRDLEEGYGDGNSYSVFGNMMPVSRPPYGDNGYNLIPGHERAADDVLLLPYFDNPWEGGSAVTGFYLSDDPARLVNLLRQEMGGNWDKLFWPGWAYELHAANGDRVYGSFKDTTWAFDQKAEVRMQSPNEPVLDAEGLKIFAYDGAVTNAEIKLVYSNLRRVRDILLEAEIPIDTTFPEVRLYPSLERIGLRRSDMAPIQYDAANQVLHVVPSFITPDDLLLSFVTWQPFMARTQELSEDKKAEIAAVQNDLSASIGTERMNRRVAEAFRIESTGVLNRPDQERPSALLQEARARFVVQRNRPRLAPVTRRPAPTAPLAGMTFAHEGYRVHNGYGGEKIKPSLDSLAELNVNALAVVPYTFQRDPAKATTYHIPDGAGGENDWATACSIREARERGWFVLLKPQIWVGGGHWPGDVDFATEAEWDDFFDNYTYWIVHYAALAEREGVDAIALGTELVKTTGKYPDRWRQIIRKVRNVYGGQLTYAANWGEEFDNFTFWEDLDAVGLNAYYPLAEGASPTDDELRAGARRWLDMAAAVSERVDRPLWLTEVGYRSVSAAWQHPHAEAGERAVSDVDQARCYAALWAEAAETPALRGAFVWKWPSYLGHAGGRRSPNRGFTPGGKAAAGRLATFYGEWGQ